MRYLITLIVLGVLMSPPSSAPAATPEQGLPTDSKPLQYVRAPLPQLANRPGALEQEVKESPGDEDRKTERKEKEKRARYTKETRDVVMGFVKELRGRLSEVVKNQGPAAAIGVCKEFAPKLAAKLSLEKGWRVSRVSLKPRNTLLGTADSWEQQSLLEFDRQVAERKDPAQMVKAAVMKEPNGMVFRMIKAMPVEEVCLMCHGDPAHIPDEVKTQLAQEYPHDLATGYKSGQVRGGLSVKRPW